MQISCPTLYNKFRVPQRSAHEAILLFLTPVIVICAARVEGVTKFLVVEANASPLLFCASLCWTSLILTLCSTRSRQDALHRRPVQCVVLFTGVYAICALYVTITLKKTAFVYGVASMASRFAATLICCRRNDVFVFAWERRALLRRFPLGFVPGVLYSMFSGLSEWREEVSRPVIMLHVTAEGPYLHT